MKPADRVVELFEEAVAQYAGAPHCIAVNSCTSALFLCLKYVGAKDVSIPCRTYVSVPNAILLAGAKVTFRSEDWHGIYQLKPYPIWDCAKRFRTNMYKIYRRQFLCLSFHAKKILSIGRGGAILTDDELARDWFRMARNDGRPYGQPVPPTLRFKMLGWNLYMDPDRAAQGLMRLQNLPAHSPDQPRGEPEDYPDLSRSPVFNGLL